MTYTPTEWRDHLVPNPGRFRGTQNADGTWTFVEDFGVPAQVGTPISATNMNKIEQGIEDAHKRETQRSTTLVVAANNSAEKSKQNADYVVPNGAQNAQDTINAAINALPAGGGKVVLLEGTYTINNDISLKSNVTIEGLGPSTIIKFASNSPRNAGAIYASGSQSVCNNVEVKNLTVDGNRAQNTTDGLQYGVRFWRTGGSNVISGVHVMNCMNTGIDISTNSGTSSAKDNYLVENCVVEGSRGGISLENYQAVIVKGNVSYNNDRFGLWLSELHSSIISNNRFLDNKDCGIDCYSVTGSNRNTITGNLFEGNANAGIRIYGSYNNIQNNTIRKGTASPTYGIRIETGSGSVGNLVTNNDLYDSGTTKFSDGGTGTITTAGNRM